MEKTMDDKVMLWWNSRPHHERKGNLHPIYRKGGRIAHLYRFYIDGKIQPAINFSHKENLDQVKSTIEKIEAKIRKHEIEKNMIPAIGVRKTIKPITFDKLCTWYLNFAQVKVSQRTLRNYAGIINNFMNWIGDKNRMVNTLSVDELNKYKKHLEKNNSALTVYSYIKSLQTVFSDAWYHRIITNNPFADYRGALVKSSIERDTLTGDEMHLIANMIWREQKSHWQKIWLAWKIATQTGMSGADILGLRFENIDFKARVISFAMAKRKSVITMLPIRSTLMTILERLRNKHGQIFSFKGFIWTEQILTKKFGYYIKKLKGKDFIGAGSQTPRKSFEKILIDCGVSYKDQCFLLGKYIHGKPQVDIEKLRQIIESLPLD